MGDTDHVVSVPELYPLNDSVTSPRCHLLISPIITLEASVADIFTLMKTHN